MALGNNYSANTDNNKKNKNISEIYVPAFNTSSPEGLVHLLCLIHMLGMVFLELPLHH